MNDNAWKRPRMSIAVSRIGIKAKPSNVSLLSNDVIEDFTLISKTVEENRGKDLDGGFFEEFEVLEVKQKDILKDAEKLVVNELDPEKPDNLGLDKLHISSELNSIQLREACKEALYTISNSLGDSVYASMSNYQLSEGNLFQYAKKAYHISDSDFDQLTKLVKDQQKPTHYLNAKVIEGRNLEIKDANGLSDPYCMLALIDEGEGRKVIKKDKDKIKLVALRQFKSEENVKMTKIQMNTLNPQWNENFRFPIKDIKTQLLRIDVWDHDDNTVTLDKDNTITAIKGFSGIGRFFKEVLQSTYSSNDTLDDFMGIAELPLKGVTFPSQEKWIPLQARSSRSNVKGDIKVKLSFSIKQAEIQQCKGDDGGATIGSLTIHKQMLKQFLSHELENFFGLNDCSECWDVKLSDQAKLILEQHQAQHEINHFQYQAMLFDVLSGLLQFVQIPFDIFVSILEDLKTCGSDVLAPDLDVLLADAFEHFIKYAADLISRHRHLFSSTSPDKCLRLGQLLLCLSYIYKLPVFRKHYPDHWLTKELSSWLVASTEHWFELLSAYNEPLERNPDAILKGWVSLVNSINADIMVGGQAYNSLFQVFQVDYTSVIYNVLEKLVCDNLKVPLAKVFSDLQYGLEHQETSTETFELYLAMRDFEQMKQNVNDSEDNGITGFQSWFRPAMNKWFDLARLKAMDRIKKAVDLDEVRLVHSMVQYSASAVDVTCCLGQICVFWNNLHWPDPTSSYIYVTQITDIVASGAMQYGEIVNQHLNEVGYYDTEGQFDVNEKLCIVMNNMEHVLHFLDSVPKVLHFEELLASLADLHGNDRALTFRATLDEILTCGKDDMKQKIDIVIQKTGERVKADMLLYLRKIRKAPEGSSPEETIVPFLEYLDSNLLTLHDSLLHSVFQRVLVHMWTVVLSSFKESVLTSRNKKKPGMERIYQGLQESRDFFYAGGKGIPEEDLNTPTYKDVNELVMLWKSSTEEVIQYYYTYQCTIQENAKQLYGSLTVKYFYCHKSNSVQLSILNGKNLPALDVSGNCDPFVTIEICPAHLFPKRKEKSTKVQKQTRFPLFDENFSIPATVEQCKTPGTILLLTVYDHDMISDNDIAGEVYIPLNKMPGLKGDDNIPSTFNQMQQIELNIIHGTITGKPFEVLKELNSMLAENFVYYRQQKNEKMRKDCLKAAAQQRS